MRFGSYLVVIALVSMLGLSFPLMSEAQNGPTITLESRHEGGVSSNLGTITFDSTSYTLSTSFGTAYFDHPITYNPPPGYSFVKWEIVVTGVPPSSVDDPNAQSTEIHLDSSTTLRAVYSGSGVPSGQRYVGGEVFSTNKLAVLGPYIALFSVVAVAAVVVRKKLT